MKVSQHKSMTCKGIKLPYASKEGVCTNGSLSLEPFLEKIHLFRREEKMHQLIISLAYDLIHCLNTLPPLTMNSSTLCVIMLKEYARYQP